MEEGGTAANKGAATGPCSTLANTMSMATHNAATFSADDIILVCNNGGTFQTTNLIPPSSGTSGHPIIYESAQAAFSVISGASGNDTVHNAAKNYLLFENLKITGSVSSHYNVYSGGTGNAFTNCDLSGGNAGASVLTGVTFTNCIFSSYTYASSPISISQAGNTSTFNYCLFLGFNGPISIIAGTTITFNNCLFAGMVSSAMTSATGSQNVNVTNSIFAGNVTNYNVSTYVVTSTVGTFTYAHSLLMGSAADPAGHISTGLTDGGGNLSADPMFASPRQPSIVMFGIDDYPNLAFAQTVAALAATHGWKITYAVQTRGVSAGDWATMASMIAAGTEVVPHTRDHSQLNNLNALTVDYTAACTTATMTVTGGVLTTAINGVTDLSLTLSGYSSITALVSAINGHANYTAAASSSQTSSTPAWCLADVSAVNIKATVYQALFDQSRYWTEEVDGSITDIEAGIPGYTLTTWVCPYDGTNAALQSYLQTKGFLGARGNYTGADAASQTLTDLFIYKLWSYNATIIPTTGGIPLNMGAELEFMNYSAIIKFFYDHDAGQYSLANWTDLMNAVGRSNATVMSQIQAVNYLRANWTNVGGLNLEWTHAAFPDTSNWAPRAGSPLIGTGTGVGLTTDYNGNPVIPGFETVGPIQYQPRPAVF